MKLAWIAALVAAAFGIASSLGLVGPKKPALATVTVAIDYGDARYPAREEIAVAWRANLSVLDALQEAAAVELTAADPTHPQAVDAIEGVRTDLAASRFWLFEVDGEHAQVAAQDYILGPGQTVLWEYVVPPVVVTIDYGADRGLSDVPTRTAEVAYEDGMTALDALRAAADVALTAADPLHPQAIDAIDGVRTDLAASRFWLYDLNGRHPDRMAHEQPIGAGFEIRWYYTGPDDRPADELIGHDDHDQTPPAPPAPPPQEPVARDDLPQQQTRTQQQQRARPTRARAAASGFADALEDEME